MDQGKNVDPQWSPDGRTIAYVSDRTGVSNVFLYDLDSQLSYQLTDLFTGAQGITPLSPSISWARQADRLAFVYYEDGKYDVYTLDHPRDRKGEPYRPTDVRMAAALPGAAPAAVQPARDTIPAAAPAGGSALYRSSAGELRRADSVTPLADSLLPPPPLSIAVLNDSAALGLPDTSTFTERPYKIGFSPDYVARPTIGYVRDNFGNGVFGGTAVSLSDMLGNHQLLFSGYVNGRIEEAQVLAAYANVAHRLNWAVGVQQEPYFFYQGSSITQVPETFENLLTTSVRRIVLRSAFAQASYPLSRFRRVELGVRGSLVDDAILRLNEYYDPLTGYYTRDPSIDRQGIGTTSFVQPSLALVDDNSIFGFTGPLLGRRSRIEVSPTVGGWRYTQVTADFRRYDKLVGPFTLATRLLYFGRNGRDADRFSGLPRLSRPAAWLHLRVVPPQRVPGAQQRPVQRHRLRLAGPAGRHLHRRGQRRAPIPDPVAALGLAAEGDPAGGRGPVLRRRRGVGCQQPGGVPQPRAGRVPRECPRPTPVVGWLGTGEPLRLHHPALRLRQADQAPRHRRVLDHLAGADVLSRALRRALLLAAAVAVASCGGDEASLGPRKLPSGIPDEGALLRLPSDGGSARLYRADSLRPLDWQIPRNVPPITRGLGADLEDEMVYAVDRRGEVIGIDLKARQTRPYLTAADQLTGTADGVVLGLDSTRHPLRFAGRNLSVFRATVSGGRGAQLLPAAGDRVMAYVAAAGTVQIFEESGEVGRISVPAGRLATSWAGDLMVITTDSGLVLAYSNPARDTKPRFVRLKGSPITSAFSPSGHRIYVARARGDLLLLDRFSSDDDQVGVVELPGPAIDLRPDRSGRWLLARPESGDSIWLVDLVRQERVATVPAPWADDLPLVSGGRNLVTRDGHDILAWDLTGATPTPGSRLSGAADDVFLDIPWRPRDSRSAPPPPDLDEVAAAVPDLPPGATVDSTAEPRADAGSASSDDQYFIQVTSSQNRQFAAAYAQQLSEIGYRARVRDPAVEGDGFKVLIGPYPTREGAEADGKRLGKPYFIRSPADRQP